MNRTLPLLALAPLLGATELLVGAVAIAMLGLLVGSLSGLALTPLYARLSRRELHLAALIIGGTLASLADLLLQATSHELHKSLQPYPLLLVLPALALSTSTPASRWAGLRAGLLFATLALVLGVLREGLGRGSLLAHADWLFGPAASGWQGSAVLAVLGQPAGALILLGLLLAALRLCYRNDLP